MNTCVLRSIHSRITCGALCAALLGLAATIDAQSPEWPQWGGITRDFKSAAKGLAASWPAAGPRQLWSRPLGEGYSSIVVDNGTLYTMYRKGEQDVVVALEAATGKTRWEYVYDAPFIIAGRDAAIVKEYHLENGTGPASTPLIVGDALFAVGPTGIFHHLNKKTGKVVWRHQFITEMQGYIRQRGYAVSPLAYKNTVILPVGAVGASVVAFNQKDGSIVWKKNDFRHAYASPFIIDVDGQEQLVLFMETEIIGIDPNNGDLFWMHPANPQGTNVSTAGLGRRQSSLRERQLRVWQPRVQADQGRQRDARREGVVQQSRSAALCQCHAHRQRHLRLQRRLRSRVLHRA